MATKRYFFKLIDSKVPVIRGKKVITNSNVGGIKNTYNIYRYKFIKYQIFGRNFTFWYLRKFIGKKTFLRPFQSVWNKKKDRLPAPYWGKGPLLNMWLILSNNFNDIKKVKVLLPEADTTSHCVKIFNVDFKSHELVKNLKSNKSFYQSKFESYDKSKKRT